VSIQYPHYTRAEREDVELKGVYSWISRFQRHDLGSWEVEEEGTDDKNDQGLLGVSRRVLVLDDMLWILYDIVRHTFISVLAGCGRVDVFLHHSARSSAYPQQSIGTG
jgi:hypothetical protein